MQQLFNLSIRKNGGEFKIIDHFIPYSIIYTKEDQEAEWFEQDSYILKFMILIESDNLGDVTFRYCHSVKFYQTIFSYNDVYYLITDLKSEVE